MEKGGQKGWEEHEGWDRHDGLVSWNVMDIFGQVMFALASNTAVWQWKLK